jgi:diguanylate cyclase (GGDEF)-like protein
MTPSSSSPSSPVRLFFHKCSSHLTTDRFILISRFILITLNYLIIFYWWQPKWLNHSYFTIYFFVFCYGLFCFTGSRFFTFRTLNLILTLIDVTLISIGYYYLPVFISNGSFFICMVGIVINALYGGPLSSLSLSLLASVGFSLAALPILSPNHLFNFYFQLVNLNLVTLLICLLGAKTKKALQTCEIEKNESKKQYHQLQVLSRIAKEINSELEIDKLLFLIIHKAGELTKSPAGGIILRDEDQVYRIKATNGMPKIFWEKEISPEAGLLGMVFTEKKTIFDKRLASDPTTDHQCDLEHYRFAIASPIWRKGEILGLIFLLRGRQTSGYTKDDKLILETLSEHAASAVSNAKQFKITTTLSLNDYLTGVGNLRFFYQQIEHTFTVAERYQQPFSLMIVDSDSLKQVNDQYGNAQGFRHIKELAEILKNTTRSSDLIARYDRDMFMIILPQTNLPETLKIAERIHMNVAKAPLSINGLLINTTVCIGLATYPTHADSVQSLITAVEAALHKAKHFGKNQIVTAD